MNAGSNPVDRLNSTLLTLDTITVVGALTLNGLPSISFSELDDTGPG